jgi:hypothetical protein
VQETGLLEQSVLLLQAPDTGGRRELLAAGGQPVGFAQWREGGPWWWPGLRPVLAVHEHEDSPLVLTIRRRFAIRSRYEVVDAEGEPVGALVLPWLRDRWGRSVIEVRQRRGGGAFVAKSEVWGEWTCDGGTAQLEFAPAGQHDPHLKMLMLAVVLQAPE